MLTTISVQIENDPYNGGIRIKAYPSTTSYGEVASVVISRKESSKRDWTDVYTIKVSSIKDLTFDLLDIVTKSGTEYSYNIELMSSDGIMPIESQMFENIKFKFEGLFIGNFSKCYVAGTNFKTETKRNTNVEYVNTLSGKYPYRVSNADTDYITGTSSGLFLKLSANRRSFEPDCNHSFSDEVLDFLCDGSNKILKTHDSQMWCVSIDSNPSKVYSDYHGMNSIQFAWTEIEQLPTSGMLRMVGD